MTRDSSNETCAQLAGRFAAAVALAACFAGCGLRAQTHKVAKPEQVVRAIAIYEWTGDDMAKPAAARLVPVSLFLNGHMEDAGVFLARPVPLALEKGDQYSVEFAGESKGMFDIAYARDVITRRSATDENPPSAWFGFGAFVPPAPPKPAKPLAPIKVALEGAEDDDKPHFAGRQPGDPEPELPAAPAASAPAVASSAPAENNPDRPHLSRRPDSDTTANVPDDDPDRPTLAHRDPKPDAKEKKSKGSDSYVTGPSTSLNDDPDRPTMRRGVPEGVQVAAELTSMPLDLHQVVAVSDPASREPHVFTREWESHTERGETLKQMEALAEKRLAEYLATNKLTPVVAATLVTAPVAKTAVAKTPAQKRMAAKTAAAVAPVASGPVLKAEQLAGYTLSYGGLPTFVYSAQSPVTAGGPVYVTLVAQRLPSGEMQVALASVTDAAHLDRTPWLRLVDAVDPDAGHRASLLFELRAQSTRQFALYRLVSAKAEQQFVTGVID